MKTIVTALVLSFLLLSVSFAQDFSFRNTNWGMSQEEVIKSEGKDPTEKTDEILTYDNEDVAGIQLDTLYFFEDNKLFESKYFKGYDDVNVGLLDFIKLDKILTQKYGKGEMKIDKPSYVHSLEDHLTSMTVSGKGGFGKKWKTKESEITLSLVASKKGLFSVNVFYESIKLKSLHKKQEEKRLKKNSEKL